MSSIAFHTLIGTKRISGRERAAMGVLCARFLKMQMPIEGYGDHALAWIPYIVKADHYLRAELARIPDYNGSLERGDAIRRFRETFDTYLNVGHEPLLHDGEEVDLFTVQLNSALLWGNPSVQLAAKLHGQCEIHAYCEQEDRPWFADLIDQAITDKVFRPDAWGYDGWAAVAEMIRAGEGPVVTSYSVCDSFPYGAIPPELRQLGEAGQERWDALPFEQQWEIGIEHLRKEPGLRLSPERLASPFDEGVSGLDIYQRALELATITEAAGEAA